MSHSKEEIDTLLSSMAVVAKDRGFVDIILVARDVDGQYVCSILWADRAQLLGALQKVAFDVCSAGDESGK